MPLRLRSILFAAVGLAALTLGTPAQAAFVLTIEETGGAPIIISDEGSPLDLSGPGDGVIDVDLDGLNGLTSFFDFTGLSAESNRTLGAPGGNEVASVSTEGQLFRTGTTGDQTITITVTDTDFLFPAFNPKFMDAASTANFRNTTDAAQQTFQSFYGPVGVENEEGIPSEVLTFNPEEGVGPFDFSESVDTVSLGTDEIPFSLTNRTVITLGPSGELPTQRQRNQFSAATTVTAIPEPATLSLLLLGLPALALRRRRPA